MDLIINQHEAQRILDYLATCPFKDAQPLVAIIVGLKPAPKPAPPAATKPEPKAAE